ncbi:hypothetical protein FRB93_005615 [Tulasnella sp. JGI-2019a]|nr:hypothetical protein FRB93_005615 [Tulasnella sp. JGI-2019a]
MMANTIPPTPFVRASFDPDRESSYERVIIRSTSDCLDLWRWNNLRETIQNHGGNEEALNDALQILGEGFANQDDLYDRNSLRHIDRFHIVREGLLPENWADPPVIAPSRQKRNVVVTAKTLNKQAFAPLYDSQAQSHHTTPISVRGSAASDSPALSDQHASVPTYKFTLPIPRSTADSAPTSRGSQREGPYKPDGVVCFVGRPRWAFGCREDKAHAWKKNSGRFSLAWLHREGVYQLRSYVYALGQVCGARLGMLVVNSAFQRFALLDDHTIAIETSTSSSSQKSIDELDDYLSFWRQIPNTLLVPSSDLSTLVYHEATQKRYIRFFQSMYYLGAYADPPDTDEYRTKALPRALQRLPKPAQDGCVSRLDTFGPGIFTPVPLPTTIPITLPPPNATSITENAENIVNATLLQGEYENEGHDAGRGGKKKGEFFEVLTRSFQPPVDDQGGGQYGDGTGQVRNGISQDKDEDGPRNGRPSDRGDGDQDEHGSRYSGVKDDLLCRAHVDYQYNNDELDFEPHSTRATPELEPDMSSTSIDMDTMTTLELYRSLLRDAGVRFRTIDSEEMDRIVHNLTTGSPTLI